MHGKRLRIAVRDQMQWREHSLDQLLPPDHRVRDLWAFVDSLDLSSLYERIHVTRHTAGAPAIDPRTLVTLWLLATLEGIGSARELEELCEWHLVYRWICGDEPVNYHTLSDFRVGLGEALDQLLTQSVTTLCHAGVATLNRVAQDGVKVRANAGASSFHREKTLREHLAEAEEQVRLLKTQLDEDAGSASRRSRAARERGAADRVARLQGALTALTQLRQANAERAESRADQHRAKDPEQLRASQTDPEARRMKMADGGFRPAFNVQYATTTVGGVIAGVAVTNEGTDARQMVPMAEQLQRRYGRKPAEMLVDGGFVSLDAIDVTEQASVRVFAPIKDEAKQLAAGGDPYAKKKGDPPAVAAWRQRMGTEEAKEIYRQRGPTAELANAQARNRGLQQFPVRGQIKTTAVATWFALAHNASRAIASGQWSP
jgi:transposase